VTPHENLKRPPPLSQASAAHAPLMITTTTTATPMKKYPPLQISTSSKIAGVKPAPLSSVVSKQTKPQVKTKIYQKTAPLPPKSKAKTQQKTAPLPPKPKAKPRQKTAPLPREVVLPDESDWPEPGFVCHQQKWYCTQNNDTVADVAAMLGVEWKALADMTINVQFSAGLVLKFHRNVWSSVDTAPLQRLRMTEQTHTLWVHYGPMSLRNPVSLGWLTITKFCVLMYSYCRSRALETMILVLVTGINMDV
jgi:hypothetical protein